MTVHLIRQECRKCKDSGIKEGSMYCNKWEYFLQDIMTAIPDIKKQSKKFIAGETCEVVQ